MGELTDWAKILEFASSPVATVILAFFVYGLKNEVKELKKEIHENGFIRKDVAEEMLKSADSTHEHLQKQIDVIFERINK